MRIVMVEKFQYISWTISHVRISSEYIMERHYGIVFSVTEARVWIDFCAWLSKCATIRVSQDK